MRLPAACLLAVLLSVHAGAQPVVVADVGRPGSLDARQSDYLRAWSGPLASAPELVSVDAGALRTRGDLRFDLGRERPLVLPFERVVEHGGGAYSWVGTEREGGRIVSQAVMTVKDGLVMGTIVAGGSTYEVRPLGGGAHAIARVEDGFAFETPEVEAWRTAQPTADPVRLAAAASVEPRAAVTVRALFAYTASSRGVTPDIELVALQSLAYANQTYANSDLDLEVEFAGTFQTSLRESADPPGGTGLSVDLGALRDTNDGRGDDVHAERDRVGADLVILFRASDNTGTLGIAYTCAVSDDLAFGIFEVDGVGVAPVFTHEVGHNMGAAHQDNPTGCGAPDGRAYAPASDAWRTIMWSTLGSETIPYFSNPDVNYSGEPTGIEGTNNNARVVLSTASVIADFRSASGGLPAVSATPANPSVTVDRGGRVEVDLELENTGTAPLRWWALSAYAPDPDYYTLGEVLGDFGVTRSVLQPALGSCEGGTSATEGFATAALPFSFPFEGEVFRSVRVSVNGYATFGSFDGCSSTPQPIGTAGGPDGLIAALWSDEVNWETASLYSQRLADGRFAIKWVGARVNLGAGRYFPVDVLLILSPDGTIDVRYGSAVRAAFNQGRIGSSVVVGIESLDGREAVTVPFSRIGAAGQIVFPNRAIELSALRDEIAAGAAGRVPLTIDAGPLPVGTTRLNVQLVTNAPDTPVLTVPVDVTVSNIVDAAGRPDAALVVRPVVPNPASGAATVGFVLAAPSDVTVSVFDALGREVRRHALGVQPAGPGDAEVETSGLPAGVYLVRFGAGEETRTQRLTVVR